MIHIADWPLTGKSSITLRLVKHEWNAGEYDPTIEDSYSVTRTVDGKQYQLYLTDTAGQEEYRSMFDSASLASTDAVLLVYDITSAGTLPALEYFMALVQMETEKRVDRGGVAPIRMVVGNKCDRGRDAGARQISSKQGLDWAKSQQCLFMETSAREMIHIEETFERKSLLTSPTIQDLNQMLASSLVDPN